MLAAGRVPPKHHKTIYWGSNHYRAQLRLFLCHSAEAPKKLRLEHGPQDAVSFDTSHSHLPVDAAMYIHLGIVRAD